MREGPGLEYTVIGLLPQGEIVERIAANADASWIYVRRDNGLKGWCFSAYLLRVESKPPPEEPPPAEGEFVSWHRVTAATLEILASSSTGAAVVGQLQNDDVVGALGATSDGTWIQIRKFDGLVGWCASSGLSNLGATVPASLMQKLFNGVIYFRKERLTPRRVVTHALAVDMRADGLKFLVTPPVREGDPPLCSQKTSDFLAGHNLQVAVNGDGYYYLDPSTYDPQTYCSGGGDPVKPNGYAASRGKVYSAKRPGQPILYINQRNEISFNKAKGKIYNAISGDRMLVEKGKAFSGLEATRVDPRTAVGLNQNGRWLILVAVDGRETSQGATFAELADLMISFGAYTAMSLDGGGSTTMVIQGADGKPRILNVPTDDNIAGHERAVANHFGINVRK
jgi:SH3-like domain-containing protein